MDERLKFIARLLDGEKMILKIKQEKPTWGAPKIRERLIRIRKGVKSGHRQSICRCPDLTP